MSVPAWPFRGSPPIRRLAGSLAGRLFALLLGALILVFAIFGAVNIRLHRRDLERSMLRSAERLNHVLYRAMSYSMLHNDRDALRQMVTSLRDEPGIASVRILNWDGRISFSSDGGEVGRTIPKTAPSCTGCHAEGQMPTHTSEGEPFQIYDEGGRRVLGVVTPIANAPSCAQADCHAHPASQRILGILDTNLSLAEADETLASGARQMALYAFVAVVSVAVLSGLFVLGLVHTRIRSLTVATRRLAAGDLGYQLRVRGSDEIAVLASSFNTMSAELHEAREESTAWARTLEERVEQKTAELRSAHEQMMQAEKMASLGKMAAVVAHEINNPLSGILTYARLLRRWSAEPETAVARLEESREALDLIQSESRRCGDIVHNLLSFSRSTPLHLAPTPVEEIFNHCVRLVAHKLELANIALREAFEPELPPVHADPAQLEQLFLALMMNAIEAMPEG
ncbi:MAG TPA: histidine kinase dimerization/phospho-acceptor domain-containing protein, partial [Thermoanaerobaculia bacterium]|nr:histidine kinase dimerization/phospho-acceptor domain-containing protein [Thermoanaerobaculia bacterium]